MGVLFRELAALYEADREGRESPLPELRCSTPTTPSGSAEQLEGEALERQLGVLAGAPRGRAGCWSCPDRPRPPVQTFRGASLPVELPLELAGAVQALARGEGATLYMVMLAAFQVLLSKLRRARTWWWGARAGRTDPGGGGADRLLRQHAGAADDLSGRPVFRELLGGCGRPRWARTPTRRCPSSAGGGAGAGARPLAPPLVQAMFACRTPVGSVEYATDLFDGTTVRRLLRRFERLLGHLAAHPDEPVAEAPPVDRAEAHQLLVEWNATAAAYEGPETLPERLAAQARRTPEAVAVVSEGGLLTYGELARRTARLAARLSAEGVGPEARVGVLMERSAELVVALLGAVEAGAAYVPLDPSYPAERLAYMAADAGLAAVVAQRRLLERLPLAEGLPVLALDGPEDLPYSRSEDFSSCRSERSEAESRNLAYAIYTSGSTGRPKGAGVSHAAIVNRLAWMQEAYGLTAADAVVQKTPYSFDVSVWEFFWPLLTGARLVVARPEGHRDGAYLAELVARERVTTMHFVPSMLQAFVEEPRLPELTSLACRRGWPESCGSAARAWRAATWGGRG
jgi:non-ribosomal peptide synthetase component F